MFSETKQTVLTKALLQGSVYTVALYGQPTETEGLCGCQE